MRTSQYFFQIFDLLIRILPGRVRRKFLTHNSLLKMLIQNGGIRSTRGQLLTAGIEGKWTESVESVPVGEEGLVSKLMYCLQLMKRQQDQQMPEYLPAHEWRRLLEEQWRRPLNFLDRNDVDGMSSFLRNFFRNEGISGFWGQSRMFEHFQSGDTVWEYSGECLMCLEMGVLTEYSPGWNIDDLDAPRVGNPWGYKIRGRLLYEPVFSYYQQAEFFSRLVADKERPVVVEIGGGFGGLASHLIKRNKNIRYIGFDLPENVIIQAYYLSCVFPELRIYYYDEQFNSLNQEMLKEYDVVILPNYCLPAIESGIVDLLANIRSFSEMGKKTIAEYFKQIDRIKPRYFFHENIFKDRGDGLYGVPSTQFPLLQNFSLIYSSPSRWVRYGADSIYPCHENLFQCK